MKTEGWHANYLRANGLANLGWAALTWMLAAFALLQGFRGQGQHFWWVLVAVALPGFRCALSHDYRQSVCAWFADSWSSLVAFHHQAVAIPWRAVFVWVVLPFVLFFLTNTKVQVGDNAPVFLAASSVVRQGTPECSEFLHLPQWSSLGTEPAGLHRCLVRTSTGIYSKYPAGPLQAAVPVALVSRLTGADLDSIKVHERLQKFTAVLLSATCLGLFFLVSLHLVPAAPAWITTVMLGTGSVMFTTISVGIWQHGGIILWSLAFLLAEFRQTFAARFHDDLL